MKSIKTLSVGMLVISSLTLTACAQEVPSAENRVPAKADAKIKPIGSNVNTGDDVTKEDVHELPETPDTPVDRDAEKLPEDVPEASEETIAEFEKSLAENPLGVDLDEMMTKYKSPDVDEVFPAADFDVKEGARYGLEFYQGLAMVKNFYDPRDTTKDIELITPVSDQMTDELFTEIQEDVATHGRFTKMMTANSDGTFAPDYEGLNLDPTNFPLSTWGTPSIGIGYDESMGNYITVAGQRRVIFSIESGETVQVIQFYTVDVVPSGDGQWLVSGIDWQADSIEVLK